MAKLLVHGTNHGKKTLKQLPTSKTFIGGKGGGSCHVFSIVFIADFQRLEDIFSGPALGGEVLDVGINWGDWSDGDGGGSGGGQDLSISNLMVVSLGSSLGLGGSAFSHAMSLLSASKTKSFPNTASSIGWEELLQVDSINIHGIGIPGM